MCKSINIFASVSTHSLELNNPFHYSALDRLDRDSAGDSNGVRIISISS